MAPDQALERCNIEGGRIEAAVDIEVRGFGHHCRAGQDAGGVGEETIERVPADDGFVSEVCSPLWANDDRMPLCVDGGDKANPIVLDQPGDKPRPPLLDLLERHSSRTVLEE